VADDERLRGHLTDAGYGPILRWAATRALALAETVDAANLESLQEGLRRAVAAVVEAAETGRARALDGGDPRVLERSALQRAALALLRAPDGSDERAAAIAQALMER
jgi:hypothetical protein